MVGAYFFNEVSLRTFWTPSTLRAATRLAASELLLSGTTTALTMETVHDTDVVFETLQGIGMRATVGKCMMESDDEVPARLRERTRDSLDESLALRREWPGTANDRLPPAFAPRFAVSRLARAARGGRHLSEEGDVLVHTHASESQAESTSCASDPAGPTWITRRTPVWRRAGSRRTASGHGRRAGAHGRA